MVVLLAAITPILRRRGRVVPVVRCGRRRVGRGQCARPIASALDLMLEPDDGHAESLLLLLDIAQVAGDCADQLLQSIKL
jgi:hypothetical protein